jgi:hypothetical protein
VLVPHEGIDAKYADSFASFQPRYDALESLCSRPRHRRQLRTQTRLIGPLEMSSVVGDGSQLTSRLYNHIRTVAFWLDAAPLLADLGLPFRVSCLVYFHFYSANCAGGIRRFDRSGTYLRRYYLRYTTIVSSLAIVRLWRTLEHLGIHGGFVDCRARRSS